MVLILAAISWVWMAQLWFWLLFGNEHNALGQGLMLGLNWLRFAWFLHWMHFAWFGLAAFWSLFGCARALIALLLGFRIDYAFLGFGLA